MLSLRITLRLLCLFLVAGTAAAAQDHAADTGDRVQSRSAVSVQPHSSLYRPQALSAVPHSVVTSAIRQVSLEQTSETNAATVRPASVSQAGLSAVSSGRSAVAFLDLDQNDPSRPQSDSEQPTNMDMLVRFAVWTIIVLCLCVLTVLGLRRWQKNQGLLPVSQGHSRVLETVMLGPNRSISLVQLRDIQALVGCDSNGIQSIVLAPPTFDTALAETDVSADHFATFPPPAS